MVYVRQLLASVISIVGRTFEVPNMIIGQGYFFMGFSECSSTVSFQTEHPKKHPKIDCTTNAEYES